MSISNEVKNWKETFFRWIVTAFLALIVFFAMQVWNNQKDLNCKIRILELNQVRIMERMGIEYTAKNTVLPP